MHFIVICLDHKTLQRTEAKTLLVMTGSEADEEVSCEERMQLLGLTPETMKHPKHLRMQFAAKT